MTDSRTLLSNFSTYAAARRALLASMDLPLSNRDVLGEFAEHLVAALTGGRLAENRNQRGWDVELPDGHKVQVKSLANASGSHTNMHEMRRYDADWFGIVFFDDFVVEGVLLMPMNGLEAIGTALKKRGKRPLAEGWDITVGNWRAVEAAPDDFRALGARVWLKADLT